MNIGYFLYLAERVPRNHDIYSVRNCCHLYQDVSLLLAETTNNFWTIQCMIVEWSILKSCTKIFLLTLQKTSLQQYRGDSAAVYLERMVERKKVDVNSLLKRHQDPDDPLFMRMTYMASENRFVSIIKMLSTTNYKQSLLYLSVITTSGII